jgi:hypothetical protein
MISMTRRVQQDGEKLQISQISQKLRLDKILDRYEPCHVTLDTARGRPVGAQSLVVLLKSNHQMIVSRKTTWVLSATAACHVVCSRAPVVMHGMIISSALQT